ncbi:helix-turn-helix transcriptional regulator [Vibrio tapetis]|uniref:Transcriptional regulator n=1 Tax=Vibrio tapetis subsp. tapetis TaxID=1671868 RepID=A0A2N8ZDA2_9VIBR|nr:WYL domain-containing protein [Vibrio tapetis]SON49887.1 conserved protein of unknown function [Vibrio tapetis subsp. tapetis]
MRDFHSKQVRLNRIIGMLENGEVWTTETLSSTLSVSIRTVARDLTLLKQQGYDIESERGTGGGICLRSNVKAPRLTLNDEEVLTTLMSLAITESLKSPVLGSNVNHIRHKLGFFLNEQQRQRINTLRKRILVGSPASSHVSQSVLEVTETTSQAINSAFIFQQTMSITYQAENGTTTERTIDPQYLLLNWPAWYLLGWDHLRKQPRMFRVDRILSTSVNKQTFRLQSARILLQDFGHYFSEL